MKKDKICDLFMGLLPLMLIINHFFLVIINRDIIIHNKF